MSGLPKGIIYCREKLAIIIDKRKYEFYEESLKKKVQFKWIDERTKNKKYYLSYKDSKTRVEITYTFVCGTIVKHYYDNGKDVPKKGGIFVLPDWKPVKRTHALTIWNTNKKLCGEWYNYEGEHIYTETRGVSVFLFQNEEVVKLNFKTKDSKFSEIQNFHRAVAVLRKEGSDQNNYDEMYWIAWVIKNRTKFGNFDIDLAVRNYGAINAYKNKGKITTNFKNFTITNQRFENTPKIKIARKAIMQASTLNLKEDPTKNSLYWEGISFYCTKGNWFHRKKQRAGIIKFTGKKGGTIFFSDGKSDISEKDTLSTYCK